MMWDGHFGMMGGWGGWGWFWPFHFIIPLLFWGGIIVALVLLVRYAGGWGDHAANIARRPSGLDVLEERYARGEINRDEFLQKRRDILDTRSPQ
jgi:putative membrane protein